MRYMTAFLIPAICLAQFPDTFLGSVSVGSGPCDICISPDGTTAWVAVEWGFAAAVSIDGYDEFSLEGLADIDGEPAALQCDETGEYLYVADGENSLVHVVNTATLEVEYAFEIEPSPRDMELSSSGGRIYIAHQGGLLTVINTASGEVEDVFWAGDVIHSLAVSPDGTMLFASDNGSPNESVISTASGAVTRFTSGQDSRCCALSGDGLTLFLSSTDWNIITPVSTGDYSTGTPAAAQGTAPVRMACLPEDPFLYAVSGEGNSVDVYSTQDLSHMGTVEVPGIPVNLAVHPDGERIFFACEGDSRLRIFGWDPAGIVTGAEGCLLTTSVSPSPVPEVLVTGNGQGPVRVSCMDLSGRTLLTRAVHPSPDQAISLSLPGLPPGMVLVIAESGDTVEAVQVVVVLQP